MDPLRQIRIPDIGGWHLQLGPSARTPGLQLLEVLYRKYSDDPKEIVMSVELSHHVTTAQSVSDLIALLKSLHSKLRREELKAELAKLDKEDEA